MGPLLVFKSTENKVPRGHISDTECRPDFTAAFDTHWGDEATMLWPRMTRWTNLGEFRALCDLRLC